MIKLSALAVFLCSVFGSLASVAYANGPDGYPSRPVTIVVPFAPGGGSDNVARLIATRLAERTGGTFIIDNKPGAGTNIGNEAAARAAKNGLTLLLAQTTLSINPSLYKTLNYDVRKDFTPIAHLANSPAILVANINLQAKSVQDVVALAKAKPEAMNFGSGGKGTSVHLAGELFNSLTNVTMTHVPYRGSAPAMTDLIGGQIQVMFDTAPSALAHIKAGKIKAIAVTGSKRLADIATVPTFIESGLPAFDAPAWYGLMAPTGTPANIVAYLNKEIEQMLKETAFADKLLQMGAIPVGGSPEQFGKFIQIETERWATVIKKNNITAD